MLYVFGQYLISDKFSGQSTKFTQYTNYHKISFLTFDLAGVFARRVYNETSVCENRIGILPYLQSIINVGPSP